MTQPIHSKPAPLSDQDRQHCLRQLLEVGAGLAARLEEIMSNKEVTLADLAFPEDIKAIRKEDRLRQFLEKVDVAIKRLDEGTFGRCLKCGGAVSNSRLLITPWVERCTPCEEH